MKPFNNSSFTQWWWVARDNNHDYVIYYVFGVRGPTGITRASQGEVENPNFCLFVLEYMTSPHFFLAIRE